MPRAPYICTESPENDGQGAEKEEVGKEASLLTVEPEVIDSPVTIFDIMSYCDKRGLGETMKPKNLENRVLKRLARKGGDVFLRDDFSDLGGYDQVGRVLRHLVRTGQLVKIGHGLYTRAAPSPFDGTPTPVKGLRALAAEALGRLGIETAPTRLEQDYRAGRTTQVPAGRVIAVNKRVRRRIGYNGTFLSFERA